MNASDPLVAHRAPLQLPGTSAGARSPQEPDRYPKTAELTRAATTAQATNPAAPPCQHADPSGAQPLGAPLRAGDGVSHTRRGARERHDLPAQTVTAVDLAAAAGDVVGRQFDEVPEKSSSPSG